MNVDTFFAQPDENEGCVFENRSLPCDEPAIWVLCSPAGEFPLCTWHHDLVYNHLKFGMTGKPEKEQQEEW